MVEVTVDDDVEATSDEEFDGYRCYLLPLSFYVIQNFIYNPMTSKPKTVL